MANRLLGRLREKNKKSGLFNKTSAHVSYPTGFLNFDFANGYVLQSRDSNDELIGEFPNIGITGGSFNTVIGRSGSAKTTATVQWGAEIVRPFENGFVMHIDLEQSTHYTRIRNLTGYSNQELQDKYVLKQEKCYMEDIFDMIMEVVNEKEAHKEDYMYEAPFTNEFGEKIKLYVPTVFILDSIPGMTSRPETKKDKETGAMIEVREMETSTAAMRNAKNLKNFYMQLMPLVKQYNIIIFAINHINSNISINPFEKKQPQLLYLKMDESLPGGSAPIYYANNIFKFISHDKATEEKNGFNGFTVDVQFLKSRTAPAGQISTLVYDQNLGFDRARTMFNYLNDNGMIGGSRKNARYVQGHEDVKFNELNFTDEFYSRPEVRNAVMDVMVPMLQNKMFRIENGEFTNPELGVNENAIDSILNM